MNDPCNAAFRTGGSSCWALDFLSITMAWSLFNAYVPIFLRQFLPSAAARRDRHESRQHRRDDDSAVVRRSKRPHPGRLGRRLPYLVVGMPLAAVAFALLPLANSLLLLILAIVAVDLSMSVFRAPTIALMPDLTPPGHRSRANGIINFMGGIGALLALSGGAWLYRQDPAYPFFLTSVAFVVVLILLLVTAREPADSLSSDDETRPATGLWRAAVALHRSNPSLCGRSSPSLGGRSVKAGSKPSSRRMR